MAKFSILIVSLIACYSFSVSALDDREYYERLTEAHSEREPTKKLYLFEAMLESTGRYERFTVLAATAKAAYGAGSYEIAEKYATELLASSSDYPNDWNYGNAIHDGNMVLGLVAVEKGDIDLAIEYLLKAGDTSGSPQINTFGPNMTLAEVLIEKGEAESVLEYFELCKKFWELEGGKLESWAASVRGGGKPDFGANLLF